MQKATVDYNNLSGIRKGTMVVPLNLRCKKMNLQSTNEELSVDSGLTSKLNLKVKEEASVEILKNSNNRITFA